MALPLNNKSIQSHAAANPAEGMPTGYLENFRAEFKVVQNEGRIASENEIFTEIYNRQAEALVNAGFESEIPKSSNRGVMVSDPARFGKQQKELGDIVDKINKENGLKLPTRSELLNEIVTRYGYDRKRRNEIAARATGTGDVGSFLGGTAAILTDPIVAISSIWGASASSGILRTMLIEAGIASSVESVIQPQVYSFKKAIDSPYSVGEALQNIAAAGGGAAALAGAVKTLAKVPAGGRELLNVYRKKKANGELARQPGAAENTAEDFLERHIEEMESNPFDDADLDAPQVHADNLSHAVKQVEQGLPANVDELKGVSRGTERRRRVERRRDPGQRKKVSQMTEAEKTQALLTDDMTGLGNYRAFKEYLQDNADAEVMFGDLDDFKGLNTKLGHTEVDEVVFPYIGEVMRQAAAKQGIKTFRRTGDEFLAVGNTQQLQKFGDEVQKQLQNATLEVELPNGDIIEHTGIGFSHGRGKTERIAEEGANANKAERKAAGLRRGDRDADSVSERAAEGGENQTDLQPAAGRQRGVSRVELRQVEQLTEQLHKQPDLLDDALDADTARILAENPDLEIPIGERIENGDSIVESISARQLLKQADEEQAAADVFTECAVGAAEATT